MMNYEMSALTYSMTIHYVSVPALIFNILLG